MKKNKWKSQEWIMLKNINHLIPPNKKRYDIVHEVEEPRAESVSKIINEITLLE